MSTTETSAPIPTVPERITIVLKAQEGSTLEQICQFVSLGMPVAIGRGVAVIANTFANCLVKTDEQCRANAAFIAGANPKAVLVLAGEIERLNEEYDKAWRHNLNDKNNYQVLAAEVVRLGADRDHLKAFAVEMINASFEGGSFDGGDIQDIAVKHGLLRIERREDECGEGCACREYGFPAECYRKTAILDTSKGGLSCE